MSSRLAACAGAIGATSRRMADAGTADKLDRPSADGRHTMTRVQTDSLAQAFPTYSPRAGAPDQSIVGRPPVTARVLGWTFAQSLRVMHATWHKEVDALDRLEQLHAQGQPYIVSFWHRKYVALFPLLRGRHGCAVTTSATNGHIVACMCRHFGNHSVQINERGSGDDSIRLIGHALAHSKEGSIAVDGPHGPYHKVKRGAIQVASALGHWIIPLSVGAQRKHVLTHRWDHLEIPKLFTRVHLAVGEPIRVPPKLSAAGIMDWRIRLHDALEAVDAEAEEKVAR